MKGGSIRQQAAPPFQTISYREVHERNLRVMDLTAITLCQENDLPIQGR